MSTNKAEVLPRGEQSDDEWESYIRDANMGNTIIEQGKRWKEFHDSCQKNHGKQGGSQFSEFALERFGYSAPVASKWVAIGRGADELFLIKKNLAPDYNAMYDYLRLEDKQKNRLLKSDEPISQKTIKAVKGTKPKKKQKASPQPDDPIQEECDDCVTDEQRWQRSCTIMAGDVLSMRAFWTREFGRWEEFEKPADLLTLVNEAAAELADLAAFLSK